MPKKNGKTTDRLQLPFSFYRDEGDRIRFWRSEVHWPLNSRGYVFLGRVVHLVGKKLFRSDWSGQEPSSLRRYKLPLELDDCDVASINSARQLLAEFRPDVALVPIPESYTEEQYLSDSTLHLPPSQWAIAYKLAEREAAESEQAIARFLAAMRSIITSFERDEIQCFLRPIEGGRFVGPMLPDAWRAENLLHRFNNCQLSLLAPFDRHVAKDRHWIFVGEDSLMKLMEISAPSKCNDDTAKVGRPQGTGLPIDEIIVDRTRQIVQHYRYKSDAIRAAVGLLRKEGHRIPEGGSYDDRQLVDRIGRKLPRD